MTKLIVATALVTAGAQAPVLVPVEHESKAVLVDAILDTNAYVIRIRHAFHDRVQARKDAREAKREAAAAAEAAAEAAAAQEAAPASVPTYTTSADGWADELAAVGFPSSVIPTMLYIIDRESGGNPNAINSSSGACGLTQLYPCYGGSAWLDPMTNLRLAYQKYQASGLSPWSM